MRTRSRLALACGLVAMLALGLVVGVGKMPAKSDEAKADAKEPLGKGKRAQEFIAAFNRGDAKAVAAFWTPDGDFIDEDGRVTKGRAAIEKMYKKQFAAQKGAKLSVTVTSVRLVTPDVAIEDGISELTPADSGPPTSAQFTAIGVKKDGQWYFESVRETAARAPSNVEHFEDLEWLIGEWVSDAKKGEGSRARYSWVENQNFIVCEFATTFNGFPVVGGTQWIAWDAVDKQVRSWTFYSGGGFGEAVWTKTGDTWKMPITGRSRDGKKVSATNILTKVDNDNATWQMTRLTVNGKPLPSPALQKLKRVKED